MYFYETILHTIISGNFFRIRSAFAFGAKRLARLLDCPKENIIFEVNQFFTNTWERHGSGHRPDTPRPDLWHLGFSNPDQHHGSESLVNISSNKRLNSNSSDHEAEVESMHASHAISQVDLYRNSAQSQKNQGILNQQTSHAQVNLDIISNQGVHTDRDQRSSKPDQFVNDVQGRYLFARTHSSPELTDAYTEGSSQGKHNRAPENGKVESTRVENSRTKNLGSENLTPDSTMSTDETSSVRHILSNQGLDGSADSNTGLDGYYHSSALDAMGDQLSSIMGTQRMHQEDQDLVNVLASSALHNYSVQVQVPLNLAPAHLPLPFSPSILPSMGYPQRNWTGMVPTNFPLTEPAWGSSNMQFPQGLVSSSLTHYLPVIVLNLNSEELIEPGNENFCFLEIISGEVDHDLWHEHDGGSTAGFDLDKGGFDMLQLDHNRQATSSGFNFLPRSKMGGSSGSMKFQPNFIKENQNSAGEGPVDAFHHRDYRQNEAHSAGRTSSSKFSPSVPTSPLRSKTCSESSLDGSLAKVSKPTRDRQGRKTNSSAEASPVHGKGKVVSEHAPSYVDDNNKDCNPHSSMGSEMGERSLTSQSQAPLNVPRHSMPSFKNAHLSSSDSLLPITPVFLDSGSQQRAVDNSGVVPFTFYPTGPPVPFLTMLPVYNFPTEPRATDATTSHFGGDNGLDSSCSSKDFDSSEGLDQCGDLNRLVSMRKAVPAEPSELPKSDILSSDFASHWQNLQYGRCCQSPCSHDLLPYPSPIMVPPMYLQGRFPWDGPGRPHSSNVNHFTQFVNYGPRLLPVSPLQSVSNRSANFYHHYGDEATRHRTGTGTYLPNPVRQSA